MDKKIILCITCLSLLYFISYQNTFGTQIVSNSITTTKEGNITITSSSAFKIANQAITPNSIILPNGTSVPISKVGYLKFPDNNIFILTKDNFIQYSNGTILVEKPHMNNIPLGASYIQKPSWMDNLPQNTTIVIPQ